MTMTMPFEIKIAVFATLIIALGWAGTHDFEAAKAQESHYNEMVCEGHWPDYRNEKPECIK